MLYLQLVLLPPVGQKINHYCFKSSPQLFQKGLAPWKGRIKVRVVWIHHGDASPAFESSDYDIASSVQSVFMGFIKEH